MVITYDIEVSANSSQSFKSTISPNSINIKKIQFGANRNLPNLLVYGGAVLNILFGISTFQQPQKLTNVDMQFVGTVQNQIRIAENKEYNGLLYVNGGFELTFSINNNDAVEDLIGTIVIEFVEVNLSV